MKVAPGSIKKANPTPRAVPTEPGAPNAKSAKIGGRATPPTKLTGAEQAERGANEVGKTRPSTTGAKLRLAGVAKELSAAKAAIKAGNPASAKAHAGKAVDAAHALQVSLGAQRKAMIESGMSERAVSLALTPLANRASAMEDRAVSLLKRLG